MVDKYTFMPRPEVADWIDENIKSWTGFCYDNIYRIQRKHYQQRFENIGFRIFIILVGMIIVSLSQFTSSLFIMSFFLCCGVVVFVFGFIALSMEVRNGKRTR